METLTFELARRIFVRPIQPERMCSDSYEITD